MGAVDKALKTALDETDGETDRDRDARGCSHLDGSVKWDHWGDQQRERKKKKKEEVTSRRLVCQKACCMTLFTMPSKGAMLDLLKYLTTLQAASKPAAAELLCYWLK